MKYIFFFLSLLCLSASAQLKDASEYQSGARAGSSPAELFAHYKKAIYQIRAINTATSQKVSIGSGFVVHDVHTLATNYHVIADVVHKKNIRLEYVSSEDKVGLLDVVAVDVIHDLAILRSKDELGVPFELEKTPEQGEPLYALGNPHDLGFIIADGINNGLLKKSARERILFSGSLNSGMSGGPTLSAYGKVVGVNVSYLNQGSNISFIVPSFYLQRLLEKEAVHSTDELKAQISEQLYQDNESYFNVLLEKKWGTSQISHFSVPTDISEDIKCWDASTSGEDDDMVLDAESVMCFSDRETFISNRVYFGTITINYSSVFAKKEMSAMRFYRLYSGLFSLDGFYRRKERFEKYQCNSHFIQVDGRDFKAVLCEQASKDYAVGDDKIGDSVLIAAEIGPANSGFIIRARISGIQSSLSRKVFKKLLEEIKWKES